MDRKFMLLDREHNVQRRRNSFLLFAAACAACLLTSCTVGPNYSKPAVPVAPTYSEPPPAKFQEGWKTAQPQDSTIRGNWWEVFGDTQLNQLEEKVAPGNFSLKAA